MLNSDTDQEKIGPSFLEISRLDANNVEISARKFLTESEMFDRLISLYESFPAALDNKIPDNKVVEYQLFWISLRGLFISSQLVLSRHIAEAYSIMSRSTEAAEYANQIRKDYSKAEIWITEGANSERFKQSFSPKWVGEETEKIKKAYKLTRDHGVHSNLSSTVFHQTYQNVGYQNAYTDTVDNKNYHRCLLYILYGYEAVLEIFLLCFGGLLSSNWKKQFKGFSEDFHEYLSSLQNYFTSEDPDIKID